MKNIVSHSAACCQSVSSFPRSISLYHLTQFLDWLPWDGCLSLYSMSKLSCSDFVTLFGWVVTLFVSVLVVIFGMGNLSLSHILAILSEFVSVFMICAFVC